MNNDPPKNKPTITPDYSHFRNEKISIAKRMWTINNNLRALAEYIDEIKRVKGPVDQLDLYTKLKSEYVKLKEELEKKQVLLEDIKELKDELQDVNSDIRNADSKDEADAAGEWKSTILNLIAEKSMMLKQSESHEPSKKMETPTNHLDSMAEEW